MSAASNIEAEDVVAYIVTYGDVPGESKIQSWGRGTQADAEEFCRRPKFPAKATDSFIAVDDWGHGKIVAATPDLATHIGTGYAQFKREFH